LTRQEIGADYAIGRPDKGQKLNKKQMMVLTTTRQKARAGNGDAQLRLGRLYARGEIVDADPVNAYVWLSRAAERHTELAARERDAIAATLSTAELEKAREMLAQPVT
jgi:TPR repeat protein